MKQAKSLPLLIGLLLALVNCNSVDETRSETRTVDKAVALLQDIEDHGAWQTITDGLESLDDESPGYQAEFSVQCAASDTNSDDTKQVSFFFEADSEGNRQITAAVDAEESRYLVVKAGNDSTDAPTVYRLDDGGLYVCAESDPLVASIKDGMIGVFAEQSVMAAGIHALSVAHSTDDEVTIVQRDATRYELESMLPDALEIVQLLDDAQLQARLDSAGSFEQTGDLFLDDETGALLGYHSEYYDLSTGQRCLFDFQITRWGDIDPILPPDPANIAEPCR